MESVEEVLHTNPSVENVKDILPHGEMAVDALVPQVSQKSNGTVEITISERFVSPDIAPLDDVMTNKSSATDAVTETLTVGGNTTDSPDVHAPVSSDTVGDKHQQNQQKNVSASANSSNDEMSHNLLNASDNSEKPETVESNGEQQPKMESSVAFETEVVVEENGSSQDVPRPSAEQDDTNLLNDLDQNIELSEVLCSSDISGNIENNNCEKKEVFNKEELLDILEGNDEGPALKLENTGQNQQNDVQIALQQLSRLQKQKKKRIKCPSVESSDKKENKRKVVRVVKNVLKPEKVDKMPPAKVNKLKNVTVMKRISKKKQTVVILSDEKQNEVCIESKGNEKDSIVNKLVKDWDEEEAVTEETDQAVDGTLANASKIVSDDIEINKSIDQSIEIKTEPNKKKTADVSANEIHTQEASRSGDEGQPQRRLGRVIKKKIIFDPDNPDTFTKGKSAAKVNPQQEPQVKKSKTDASIRPKSKSPVSKLQWKKPTPKANKQNKRLTEVDKLLMDEGAVNMIYQLTPEASKGKKNVRTKAEFIKKLQSSTPESSEMKFRERKKECKDEEAKKILGGKSRTSLSSSVKSMSVCEDFETNSAEDSIIYRRHSSSSYSSSCMSPRRMSDVEGNVSTVQATPKSVNDSSLGTQVETPVPDKSIEVVIAGTPIKTDIIDKEDCLSIKQKLNSKLSLALNKRKRENIKTDKPSKVQKVKESPSKSRPFDYVGFKYLNVKIDHRLAEITITHIGKKSVAVLKEIERALLYVNGKSDVNVTLLTSVCGTLCPSLNLQPLLDNNIETRTNAAHELAESVRALLLAARRHAKLLVACAWAGVAGVGLALLALSDVPLAGERAVLALGAAPGAAALALPRGLVGELLLLERRLSAHEAAACGLVTRVLSDAPRAARALALQLAAARAPTIQLKKRLLNLNADASEAAFMSSLEAERDLFVEYWTSVEGQEMIRAQVMQANK